MDLPVAKAGGPTVHTRIVQGYEELERQRDIALGDAREVARDLEAERLRAARRESALLKQQDALEQLNQDRWEALEDAERELRSERDAGAGLRETLWDAWIMDDDDPDSPIGDRWFV